MMSKILDQRFKLTKVNIVQNIKLKVSFFGIYSLNEKIQLEAFRMEILRKKPQRAIKMLLMYQNRLLTGLREDQSGYR